MLLPALEIWRSQLQGSDSPLGDDEERGTFDRELLLELNDLSNFLEKVRYYPDLPSIQAELDRLLEKNKPVGMSPRSRKCQSCGRSIP